MVRDGSGELMIEEDLHGRESLSRTELRRLLTQKSLEIEKLQGELDMYQTTVVNKMRYDYHKELYNLR